MKEKKFHLQNLQHQLKKIHFYISDHIYHIDSNLFKKGDNLIIDEMRTELHIKVQ